MASSTNDLPFYSSCDVADALLVLGVPSAGYIPDIHLWSPEYKAGNTRGTTQHIADRQYPLSVLLNADIQ